MAASSALWLFATGAAIMAQEAPQSDPPMPCTPPEVDRATGERRLIDIDWLAFSHVARDRIDRGLEPLPGMVGCPSIGAAAREVSEDRRSAALLRGLGQSAEDYMAVGWAVLAANDPEFFGLPRTGVVAANARFIAARRAEVNALLFRD